MPIAVLTSPRHRGRLAAALTVGSMLLGAQAATAQTPPTTGADLVVDARADTDGDGLLDVWETDGYDADGDGDIDVDLPALGADPQHKDVFVEMDYMGAETTCPCHLPLAKDLRRIVKVYSRSPDADNPDGKRGITMHLDAGPARVGKYDLGGGNLVPHDDDLDPVNLEFEAIKDANFDPDRSKIFHYMVWAHGYGGTTSSGLSFGIPASDFIVTLGAFPEHGTSNAKVGTFVHEIGHNFGRQHGGDDSVNYKPNFLSVMAYTFQIDGVPRVGDRPAYFGYSRAELPALDESNLDEEVGLDSPEAAEFRTSWWCPDRSRRTSRGDANGPLDWTCNGSLDSTVAADVNGDGGRSRLESARDWGRLVFDGGELGVGGETPAQAMNEPELTAEQYVTAG